MFRYRSCLPGENVGNRPKKKRERLFSGCLSQNKISYRSNVWIRFQLSEMVGMGRGREGRENKSGGTVEMEVWSR